MKNFLRPLLGPPGHILIPSLLIGLSSCGIEKKPTNRRTIPLNPVKGEFIIQIDSAENKIALEDLSKYLEKSHNCETSSVKKLSLSENASQSEMLKNQFAMQLKNCLTDAPFTEPVLNLLEETPFIKQASANAKVSTTAFTENDPYKTRQYYLSHLNRDSACSEVTKQKDLPRNSVIVVAVLDSGVEKQHPDLKGTFYQTEHGTIIGANFVGKGANAPADDNWNDVHGHGTHVAGTIAASSNNRQGITGIASCANVKIMPVKVLGDQGSGSTISIQRGIDWAIDNGADIVNLSLGSVHATRTGSRSFRSAIYDYAAERGVIVVAAAGNDGQVNGSSDQQGRPIYNFPSSYENVISVASTDSSGKLSSFSNRGELVDVAAPGSNIIATYKGKYASLDGTSMATPAVAASLALALTQIPISNMVSHDQALELLNQSTVQQHLDSSDVASGGIIDIKKLLEISKSL